MLIHRGVELRRHLRRRWVPVLIQTGQDIWAANVIEWAAALAFYAVLSLFPLLLAGAVLASVAVDPEWAIGRVTALLGEFLPRGEGEVEEIVKDAVAARERVGIVSVIVFLLTGRRVLGALTKALNLVSDVDEQADPLPRRALAELALLAGLGLMAALALLAGPALDVGWDAAGIAPGPQTIAFDVLTGAIRGALLLATFFLVYTVVPRGRRRGQAALIGAGAATLLFLLARLVFGAVIGRVWPTMELVYGPLAIATVLLLWCWYVALITLAGASIASHVKTMLLEGHGAAETEQRHAGEAPRIEESASGKRPVPDG